MKSKLKTIDKGILFMLLSSMFASMLGGSSKILSASIPSVEITFFHNLFGVVLIGYSIYKTPLKQIGGKPWLLLFRGVVGFMAMVLYFYVMPYLPLGEVVTYSKIAPIFVAIFAYIFLKEKLNRWSIFAILLGFLGIVFIAQPTGISFTVYDILGIFSGVLAGLAYTSIRELGRYYDSRAIVMSFMSVGMVASSVFMVLTPYVETPKSLDFLFSSFVMPQGEIWFYIVFMGISATLAMLFMTKAYVYTKGGVVGTISYLTIVFSLFIGVFLGDAFPDLLTSLGMILVISSGVIVALSNR